MNAERIAELLADSSKIKEEPLESFERLAIAYPYSQSIQLLYAKKLESLGHSDISKTASWQIYFPDKNHLYSKIKEDKGSSFQNEVKRIDEEIEAIFSEIKKDEKIDESEDIIEQEVAKEIISEEEKQQAIEQEKEALKPVILDKKELIKSPHPENDYSEDIKFIDVKKSKKKKAKKGNKSSAIRKAKISNKKIKAKKQEQERKKKKKSKSKQEVTKAKTIVTKIKKQKKTRKKLAKKKSIIPALPTAAVSKSEDPFVLWLATLKKKEQTIIATKNKKKNKELETSKEKSKTKKKSKNSKKSKATKSKSKKEGKAKKSATKQSKLQTKIDSSLNRRKEVVSPTLADLLAKQGHNKEAIKIYKQLMLNNPEKSSYFAAQIKKLK